MGNAKPTTEHINEAMNNSIAEQKPIATASDIQKQFESKDNLYYIKSDDVVANPTLLLGSVFYENKGDPELQQFVFGIDGKVDESSILKTPLVRSEMVISQKIGASAGIMSYVSLKLETNEVFEFRVVDNFAARLRTNSKEWYDALNDWSGKNLSSTLLSNPNVGNIGIVIGIVQKYISTKKYKKFDGSAKGGAFGINVAGELYTSSSEYSLDIVYGLNMIYYPKTVSTTRVAFKAIPDTVALDTKRIEKFNNSLELTIKHHGLSNYIRKETF